jgi:hypothetical protein
MEATRYQLGRPVEVRLAHEPPDAPVARAVGDEEPAVAHVAAAARVVRLDVEAAQTQARPVVGHRPRRVRRVRSREQDPHAVRHAAAALAAGPVPLQHHAREVAEPVRGEALLVQGLEHRVRVAAVDLAVELRAQVLEQRARRSRGVAAGEGDQRCHRQAVAQGDAAREDGGGQGRGRAAGRGRGVVEEGLPCGVSGTGQSRARVERDGLAWCLGVSRGRRGYVLQSQLECRGGPA